MSLTIELKDGNIIYESGFHPVPGGWSGVIYWRVQRGRNRHMLYNCPHQHDSQVAAWQCARNYVPNIPREHQS